MTVFAHSILNKEPIGNELLRLHDILVTHTKFINKLCNLVIFMSCPEMGSSTINILNYASYISEVLGLKGSGTLKALIIYQVFST